MRKPVIRPISVGGVFLALAVVGCAGKSSDGKDASKTPAQGMSPSSSKPAALWPAPSDPLARAVAAGLKPEVKEQLAYHVHAHLDVFVDGRPITVPAGIGINIDDPEVRRFTDTPDGSAAYGGIEQCRKPCISPLHTHDTTGILHTESATAKRNTLGQFFTEWGVRLSSSCVADR